MSLAVVLVILWQCKFESINDWPHKIPHLSRQCSATKCQIGLTLSSISLPTKTIKLAFLTFKKVLFAVRAISSAQAALRSERHYIFTGLLHFDIRTRTPSIPLGDTATPQPSDFQLSWQSVFFGLSALLFAILL